MLDEEGDEIEVIRTYWSCKCKFDLLFDEGNRRWKKWMPTWTRCKSNHIYPGYLETVEQSNLRYFSFFYEYLEYVNSNQKCSCYWPELSSEALFISNTAYDLFKDLIKTTALIELVNDESKQAQFLSLKKYANVVYTIHGVTVEFVRHCLLFSDYDWVCRDLIHYSQQNYDSKSIGLIKNKIDNIRSALGKLYLNLYKECIKSHPSPRIQQEIYLIENQLGFSHNINANANVNGHINEKLNFDPECTPSDVLNDNISLSYVNFDTTTFEKESAYNPYQGDCPIKKRSPHWLESEICLEKGTIFNDLLLHADAIKVLSEAIAFNPQNRDAYIERAIAFFETNQLSLALKDYEQANKLTFSPPFMAFDKWNAYLFENAFSSTEFDAGVFDYSPESKVDFSQGLVMGTIEGAGMATAEFIPSTAGCIRGIANGLWAFVCNPNEVSRELVQSAYALGQFINENSSLEYLEVIVPELKDLALTWDKINDQQKGRKIGFIIGKYGVDIFAPGSAMKMLQKFRALKRANAMCTLENCAASQLKQAKVVEESGKLASKRGALITESQKTGKILVQNSNVQYHIMQKKHLRDKLVKLTRNVEEDFKKVVKLLEENKIHSPQFLEKSVELQNSLRRIDYGMTIGSSKVLAVFTEYANGEIFLMNAWIML